VRAQQAGRVPRVIVWLGGIATDSVGQQNVAAFRDGMRGLGWMDGQNVRIEERWIASSFTAEEVNASAVEVVQSSRRQSELRQLSSARLFFSIHRRSLI